MGFMAGFGQGFSQSFNAAQARKHQREQTLLASRLGEIKENKSKRDEAKAKEADDILKAKAIAKKIQGAPADYWRTILADVQANLSAAIIIKHYQGGTFTLNPQSEGTVAPASDPAVSVEEQMHNAVPVADTTPTQDVTASESQNFFGKLANSFQEMGSDKVDSQIKATMGDEAYAAAQEEYTPITVDSGKYSFTPKPEKKDEEKVPTSFEQVAVLALQSTPGWEDKTPEEKQKLAAASKQLLNASTKGEGASTLTDGVLAANIAKYTMMMGSSVPEEVATAEAWFATEYLAMKSALEQVKALGKTDTPKAPPKLKVKVQDGEGKTRVVEATLADGGTYISVATGKPVEGNVISAQSSDTFGEMTKATTATIGLRTDYTDQRTATITVAKAGLELDKIAEANELALSSVTGKGVSFFQSSKQELLNIISLVGEKGSTQEEDNWLTGGRLVQDLNAYINDQAAGGNYTKEQADQIKLFAAASVRYIFAAGKALDQQGNGFSNQDYKVIRDSIINSNSYEAFSENLRKFSRERFDEMASHAKTITQNGSIINALDLGAPIEFDIMGVEEYMGKVPGFEGVWAWANSSVGDIDPSTLAELNK